MAQLQLSAISDLSEHTIGTDGILSGEDLVNRVANLSIEVTIDAGNGILRSKKMPLDNLLSAIVSYVGDKYVLISGETRVFAPGTATAQFTVAPQGNMTIETSTTLTLAAKDQNAKVVLDPGVGEVKVEGNTNDTGVGTINAVAKHALWS